MTVNFSGYNENALTFQADESVKAGSPVKMKESGTVTLAADGERFIGIALNVREGYAAVQLSGYVETAYTGSVGLGYVNLASNGTGVKALSSGVSYTVICKDDEKIGFIL